MKKLLIVSHSMELGGAERALLGLLYNIDYSKYSVELFLERHTGELLRFIPEEVKLLPEKTSYACMAVPGVEVFKKGRPQVALGRYIGKKMADRFKARNGIKDGMDVLINYSQKYTVSFMPEISRKQYDLVISFLTPHYFAAYKTKAKTKIAWIHTDYSKVEIDADSERKMWGMYDRIISISPEVTNCFLKIFPEFKDRITVIPNMHPVDFIKERSREFVVQEEMPDGEEIKLLSVGRFCEAKNFDNIPFICKELIETHKQKLKWYIIGYGTDEKLIKSNIQKAGMENHIIILGKKENPYPYISRCDFYVQPSRYEGNAVTVNEALILQKNVIITDYPTAKSQITNGVDGVIVPLENRACAKEIAKILSDKELCEKIRNNLPERDYSNSAEVEKLYSLMR